MGPALGRLINQWTESCHYTGLEGLPNWLSRARQIQFSLTMVGTCLRPGWDFVPTGPVRAMPGKGARRDPLQDPGKMLFSPLCGASGNHNPSNSRPSSQQQEVNMGENISGHLPPSMSGVQPDNVKESSPISSCLFFLPNSQDSFCARDPNPDALPSASHSASRTTISLLLERRTHRNPGAGIQATVSSTLSNPLPTTWWGFRWDFLGPVRVPLG